MMKLVLWILIGLPITALAATPAEQAKTLQDVRLVDRTGHEIPLSLSFVDENQKDVTLRQFFQDKPVVLAPVYYRCPMLCTETLNGLVRAARSITLSAGKDYRIVVVSFNSSETPELAAAKKRVYVDRYGRKDSASGWTFLTGREEAIHALTEAIGFHYTYDPSIGEYAHGTELIVLTPQGKVARYLYGVEYSAKDLRLALVEASQGRLGGSVGQLLLYCYHYDPLTGRYGVAIMRIIRVASLMTVLFLIGIVGWFLRHERKAAQAV